ncbi:primary-amine oxidase (plasmid) [Halarchaeum sp. CBA1220]|uniref:primary-amine oxidase n=1 Tax=Halarchaeum sp. CBA1220 TaxID=1853682 RepID=UPI000F3AA221|nr:primary-amine oxidase [Halarchaeum sp. CBA1220]QLC35349.1 primary-amine oxidase [Halarchaeum sp. CBA1220]
MGQSPTSVSHPLDPLTPEEIEVAAEILKAETDVTSDATYHSIVLEEPPKAVVRNFDGDGQFDREAFLVVREEKATYEATVSLTDETCLNIEHVEDVEPAITPNEVDAAEEVVKSDPDWQAAAAKRGVEDFELAIVDPWPASGFEPDGFEDRRLVRGLSWIRTEEEDNGYARPIEGLFAYVDLDEMEVVHIEDNGVVDEDSPLPSEDADYRADRVDTRDDFEHLDVVQPDGPSFEVDDWTVDWLDWEFQVGWTPREGLVFHDVTFDDGDEKRKVLHRASASEMAVPYGDPDVNHSWKDAFDIGEFHVGRMANVLTEGCDCLGEMQYFDVAMNDVNGESKILPNAVCMHEEDDGVLWKHTEWRKDHTEVRRRRRLVVSFIATVYNYDYGFYWYFYPDGSIEGEVRLTGIDSNGMVPADTDASETNGEYAIVGDQVKTPIHQHHFNFRLDFDIDDTPNQVMEVHNEPVGSERKNGFRAKETVMETEQEARDDIDPLAGKFWRVESTETTNSYGRPCGYKLVPHSNVNSPAKPTSSVKSRAGFIQNNFWATQYDPDEQYAAGDYPNQNDTTTGLAEWTEQDRDLVGEDVVLWYTLGVNHVTRPEDWPVLPVEIASFHLKPEGFLDSNPSITLPPEPDACEHDLTSTGDD